MTAKTPTITPAGPAGGLRRRHRSRQAGRRSVETRPRIHRRGDAGYDLLRRPLNPALDPHPALIVDAAGPADAQAAVRIARERDVPLAIQATGHGTHDAADGAVLLRTTRMSAVHVDPARRVARVGAGATWGAVLGAAAPYGLAPLSGSSPSVGVTGFTLGGGIGWLSRRHGFAADSLIGADVVTAGGTIVTANAEHHPDLFWALRGGGGNFGVVTALELRLFPVETVYAGTSYHPVERAADVLAAYDEWAAEAPDELSTAVLITRIDEAADVPARLRGRRVLALRAMHSGALADAESELAYLRRAAGPTLHDGMRPVRYASAVMGGTPPRHLDLVDELPEPLIGAIAGAAEDPESPISTVEVRQWGGAIAHPAPGAGPVGHREARFSVIADAADPDFADALWPFATGGSFLNFLADTSRTATAYAAENHRRLAAVKAAYDPANLFRFGHNIAPRSQPQELA